CNCLFFFQAEDGIRDRNVTGVQTCALPISFSNDRVVLNSQGKLNAGLGVIYLQNAMNDAAAISYNIAGRMKTYRWDKSSSSWKRSEERRVGKECRAEMA